MEWGIPWFSIYMSKKLRTLAFSYIHRAGYFENRSIAVTKYTSAPFSSKIRLAKSICNSWFGSTHGIWDLKRLAGITDFKFLQIAVRDLHSVALTTSSRFIYGHQQCMAIQIIPHVPGWLACMSSIKASRNIFGIATFSSTQTQPDRTWRSLQYDCMYGLRAFRQLSFLIRMQSRTSFIKVSLLVSEAIKDLLNIFLTIWSKVGNWGLGVRGVLRFEDKAGDVGVEIKSGFAARVAFGGVKGWFAARVAFAEFVAWFAAQKEVTDVESELALWEASLKRTLVIRFFEGILYVVVLIWFISTLWFSFENLVEGELVNWFAEWLAPMIILGCDF